MRLAVLILILIIQIPLSALSAAEMPIALQKERAREGLDLLLRRDYGAMEVFLKKVVHDWPEANFGYFGQMVYYQIRNLDNFDFRFDPQYRQWHERGRSRALKVFENPDRVDPWENLIAGGMLGMSAFYLAHNGKWIPAMRDSSKGMELLEKGYHRDSQLFDALLGIGLHDYWRSHYTRLLRFLPFFADRRKEGRGKIMLAGTSGAFAGPAAEISLAYIEVQEKEYAQVLAITIPLLSRYPNNVILRMLQGETLLRIKKYPEAIREFETILEIDPSVTKAHLFLGLIYARQAKDEETRERARKEIGIFMQAEPNAHRHWRKPALETLKQLTKETRRIN